MHGLLATAALAAETAIVAGPLVAVDLKRDRAQEDIVEAWTRLDARASGGTDSSRWRLGVRAEHALRAGIIDDGAGIDAS